MLLIDTKCSTKHWPYREELAEVRGHAHTFGLFGLAFARNRPTPVLKQEHAVEGLTLFSPIEKILACRTDATPSLFQIVQPNDDQPVLARNLQRLEEKTAHNAENRCV